MKKIRVVASMLVRNEADFIEEVVNAVFQYVDDLAVLDGASTDGTREKLLELGERYGAQGKVLLLRSRPDPEGRFKDLYRQELLELARELGPDWHWTIDGDEYPDEDPMPYIQRAESGGYNVIECPVPNFWLTVHDIRHGLILEELKEPLLPVMRCRRWYSWGWRGDFIFREQPNLYYPDERKRTAEGYAFKRRLSPGPIIRHYPFRTLSQSVQRAKERLERGGTYFFGKYAEQYIVDEKEVGLYYLDKWQPPGYWVKERNHEAVYAWFEATSGRYRERLRENA